MKWICDIVLGRWGDGHGIYAYSKEAQELLKRMVYQDKLTGGHGFFDKSTHLVTFSPRPGDQKHTDPSYHLPAFLEVWARFTNIQKDRKFYMEAAASSRRFLQQIANNKTALWPDYCMLDGSPMRDGNDHTNFSYDAWRVVMNVGELSQ